VCPPVEFGVEYGKVKGMVAGASAEPSSSCLHPIPLDKSCPSNVESCKNLHEVVRVWFTGLVIRVPPS
jgi:hypothetical protein